MRILPALLLATACTSTQPQEPDAGADDAGDAGRIDAPRPVDAAPDLDAIDGSPIACPATDGTTARPRGSLPSGTWRLGWSCISGCGTAPVPDLAQATFVDVTSNGLRWRNSGGDIATTAAIVDGTCFLVEQDFGAACRGTFQVCGAPSGSIAVQNPSWLDVATGWRQTWEANGAR